jgi:Zn-dependent protease with chaperone function
MGLPLLFIAAFSVVASLASVAVGAALLVGARRIGGLTPAARARVLLAMAAVPAFAGLICVSALLADTKLMGCHAHGCLRRGAAVSLPPLVLGLAIIAVVRVGATLARVTRNLRLSAIVCRRLAAGRQDGPAVLPLSEPHAFVAGLFRPRVYVSEGLLVTYGAADLEVVLEHEQAHVRRRDPLRRLLASAMLAFHVPGIASWLSREIVCAQEMAADADAAAAVLDAPRVAEALVRMARLRLRRPALVTWLDDHLEARVRVLLEGRTGSDGPAARTLVVAAAAALALGITSAEAIHRGAEALFRLLAA